MVKGEDFVVLKYSKKAFLKGKPFWFKFGFFIEILQAK